MSAEGSGVDVHVRELVGEWWEVRSGDVCSCQSNRESAIATLREERDATSLDWRLVHVRRYKVTR